MVHGLTIFPNSFQMAGLSQCFRQIHFPPQSIFQIFLLKQFPRCNQEFYQIYEVSDTLSLVTNILLVLAKIPLVTPFAGYNFYNHIYFGNLWSDLYFTTPGIYVLLYVLLDTIYGGLFALLGFSIGFYLRNIIAVTLSPFLLMIAAGYFESILQSGSTDHVPVEFVPTLFLHSQSLHSQTMAWSVILVTTAILTFSLFTIFVRGTKDEIM